MKLLFICTGNICRSPTAEGIVKHICSINNLKNLKCDSAALYDYHTGEFLGVYYKCNGVGKINDNAQENWFKLKFKILGM